MTGGKQYKVEKGATITVERLTHPEKDNEVTIKDVLMVHDGKEVKFGRPFLKDAEVVCDVVSDFRGKKLMSYKYRRRKDSHWKKGHRQELTKLKIKEIKV
jgi:large subunit ribosomal protein L21